MTFQPYLPCERLKPYIKEFIISESSNEQIHKVLPDTSLVMGFQYRRRLSYTEKNAEITLATSGITGIQNRFHTFKNSSPIGSLLVVFKEIGAVSFFKEPINEFFGESLFLDTFFSSAILRPTDDQ